MTRAAGAKPVFQLHGEDIYESVDIFSDGVLVGTFLVSAGNAQPPTRGGGAPTGRPTLPSDALKAAESLEKAYSNGARPPESVRMLTAILRGSQLGPGEGWFGPAQSRYTWQWLAAQCGLEPTARAILRDKFRGPDGWFARLDRNKDGRIGPDDLDWSEAAFTFSRPRWSLRLFRRMNAAADGKLTRDQMLKFFETAAQGKDYVSPDDLRDALLGGASGGFSPGDGPTPDVLVRGLFAGEIGSLNEGPQVDQPAPNFTLKTADGKAEVQLAQLVGSKPVVLVFGNFTCGPFRAYYPEVETVFQRFKGEATF